MSSTRRMCLCQVTLLTWQKLGENELNYGRIENNKRLKGCHSYFQKFVVCLYIYLSIWCVPSVAPRGWLLSFPGSCWKLSLNCSCPTLKLMYFSMLLDIHNSLSPSAVGAQCLDDQVIIALQFVEDNRDPFLMGWFAIWGYTPCGPPHSKLLTFGSGPAPWLGLVPGRRCDTRSLLLVAL